MHLEETPAISAYMWAMVGLCLATPFFSLKKEFRNALTVLGTAISA